MQPAYVYMNISNIVCWDISVKKRYDIIKIFFFVTPIEDENTVNVGRFGCHEQENLRKINDYIILLFVNYTKKK